MTGILLMAAGGILILAGGAAFVLAIRSIRRQKRRIREEGYQIYQ